jgi:hypothetical protein
MAATFRLDGDGWQRHANPWSVYTRIPIPALIAAAVWSRDWIGWWCLIPVAAVVTWAMVNPTFFRPPRSLDHWASRAVLGETYWADRKNAPIPEHHRVAPIVLTVINTLGVPFIVWALVTLDFWMLCFGLAVHMAGKNWFMDRMALIYDELSLPDGSPRAAISALNVALPGVPGPPAPTRHS